MSDRRPCKRCGALVLPETLERTGGECMPCKKGLRQLWARNDEIEREERKAARAFRWEPAANDLAPGMRDDAIAFEKRVIPRDVFVSLVGMFAPNRERSAVSASPSAKQFSLLDVQEHVASVTLVLDWRVSPGDAEGELRRCLAARGVAASHGIEMLGSDPGIADRLEHYVDAVNRALGGWRLRRWRASLGTDTAAWVLLERSQWQSLEARHPQLVRAMFA